MSRVKTTVMRIRSAFPLYFIIISIIAILSLTVHILSVLITPFANFINDYPAAAVRRSLAFIFGFLPFSFAEIIIILLPASVITIIVFLIVFFKKGDSTKLRAMTFALLSALLTVYISFVFTLGTAYHTSSIDQKMGLEKNKISVDELKDVCTVLANGISSSSGVVSTDDGKSSDLPYSYSELCEKINLSYKKISEQYEFLDHYSSSPKKIMLSSLLTHTHVSGVYSFFTGEANVNVNYPDYILPFTVAHEMAHQRGIAREDEANFVAFLVCINSDDEYIRYSGYTQIYEYAANALYAEDPDAYFEVLEILDPKYLDEANAYNDFMDDYDDSPVSDISSGIYDVFQQAQGQSAGVKSYGLVVDLAVAFYKFNGKIPLS